MTVIIIISLGIAFYVMFILARKQRKHIRAQRQKIIERLRRNLSDEEQTPD